MPELINQYQIWVIRTQDNGEGDHPGTLAALVTVSDDGLIESLDTGEAVQEGTEDMVAFVRDQLVTDRGEVYITG